MTVPVAFPTLVPSRQLLARFNPFLRPVRRFKYNMILYFIYAKNDPFLNFLIVLLVPFHLTNLLPG